MAKTKAQSEFTVAEDLTGAKITGINAEGQPRNFPIDQIIRSDRKYITAASSPDAIDRFVGESYPVEASAYGATFPNFGGVSIPASNETTIISNAKVVWNAGVWQAKWISTPAPSLNSASYSLGEANGTFSTTSSADGLRANATPFSSDGVITAIFIWCVKAGQIEYKLFSKEVDGSYKQYYTHVFNCVLGMNTFTAVEVGQEPTSSQFVKIEVLKESLEAAFIGLAGTGQVGLKSVTNAAYNFGTSNITNGQTAPAPSLSAFLIGIKSDYISLPLAKSVFELEKENKYLTRAVTYPKTSGYPLPATLFKKGIYSGVDPLIGPSGALVDSSDYNLTGVKVIGGESVTLSGIAGATYSNLLGFSDKNGDFLSPRFGVDPFLVTTPTTYTVPPTAVMMYYYHDRFTTPVSTYKILITFNDRKEKEISELSTKEGLTFDLKDFRKRVETLESNGTSSYYLPRPTNGLVHFQVPVNCNIPDNTTISGAQHDFDTIFLDWGLLMLPVNYTIGGDPIKLIINCHGTGTWINGDNVTQTAADFWLSQGYALLDMNGIPAGYNNPEWNPVSPDYSDNGNRHYGAPFALQSYIKGYKYVTEKYNISKEGCFVIGISMGGLVSNLICQSGSVPVIAQAGFAPCLDHYKQAYIDPWNDGVIQRAEIAKYFGFEGTAPTFTNTKPATQAERDYYIGNIYKILGYSPMLKNVPMVNVDPGTTGIYKTVPSSTIAEQPTEALDYAKFSKFHNVPYKIWHNTNDPTVKYRYSRYFVDMVKRQGGLAELRSFSGGLSGQHHNAWLNGVTVSDIPTITEGVTTSIQTSMYECYLWFKRFQ